MRSLIRLAQQGFSRKPGIAETAKEIQKKIMGLTQTVPMPIFRTMSNSSEL